MPTRTIRLFDAFEPENYKLSIHVDPRREDFNGTVKIALKVKKKTKVLRIHAVEIKMESISVDGKSIDPAKTKFDKEQEIVTIPLAAPLKPGNVELVIAYRAPYNRQMEGLYLARAMHEGKEEMHAWTKFEPCEARRMLPCVDEPEAKATFDVTITAPEGMTVLANTPAIREAKKDGFQEVEFGTTPKMSTYLLALGVARLESKSVQVGATKVSVWTLPQDIAQSDFALECGKFSLEWLNRYFDMPYPLEKLDLVAVPEFAAGAMENWGLITFRDSAMLVDPKLSSGKAYRRVAEVVAHEIVHQWFGNLVTMRWWDDLWLNEAFATWVAYKVVDDWKPEWKVWLDFELGKAAALGIDALKNTRPIVSDVHSVADIAAMFDLLTYEKGGSVLRMIEHFLGAETFQKGIRAYMKKYQYGNTEALDLWRELETASGQPVIRMAKDWLSQPGFPMLELAADPKGKGLKLTQRRFSAHGPSRDGRRWTVPVVVKYRLEGQDKPSTHRLLAEKRSTAAVLPGAGSLAWAYGNGGETGYYRVTLDAALQSAVSREMLAELGAAERFGLLTHLWAQVRNGELPLARFFGALAAFRDEDSWIVLDAMRSTLKTLNDCIAETPEERAALARFGRDLFILPLHRFGWNPQPGEEDGRKLARASVLSALGSLGPSREFLAQTEELLSRYFEDPALIDPSLASFVLDMGARHGGADRFAEYRERRRRAATPEQKDHLLKAMTEFAAPAQAREMLSMTLSADVLGQDVWKPFTFALRNPQVQAETWRFARERWAELRKKAGDRGVARIIEASAGLWSPAWRKEVDRFCNQPKNRIASAERSLRQALEAIDLGIRFKKKARGLAKALPAPESGAGTGTPALSSACERAAA